MSDESPFKTYPRPDPPYDPSVEFVRRVCVQRANRRLVWALVVALVAGTVSWVLNVAAISQRQQEAARERKLREAADRRVDKLCEFALIIDRQGTEFEQTADGQGRIAMGSAIRMLAMPSLEVCRKMQGGVDP